ncbi:MAG: peptidylprolyl isomerase [Paludibacteraceae bacterium]|nr:peptidylprolyl isomerase [Paludibacteraceae bacterium]
MKRAITAAVLALSTLASAQTVITIGDEAVSKEEFEYYYHKNNHNLSEEQLSAEAYAQLFVNFKLKVKAAYDAKYDTVRSFQDEFNGYREQLADQYLGEPELKKALVQEALDHLKEDLEVSHILIRCVGTSDTLAAYQRALELREKLTPENFNEMAAQYSEDPTASVNKGHLRYITGMSLIYAFEHAAYNTPAGTISMPVRTPYGYHLIYVSDRRPAVGEIQLSAIVVRRPQVPEDEPKAKARIDSLYQVALKGERSFDDLINAYSEDPNLQQNGGRLPWLGLGRVEPEVEDQLFGLKNIGDITAPIDMRFGWFIFRLEDRRQMTDREGIEQAIEARIQMDERRLLLQNAFINRLKREYRFERFTDRGDTLAHFADVWVTEQDLSLNPGEFASSKEALIEEKLVAYERAHLEDKYPEFGFLMQEYRDGILLFNISNELVWNKAANDEAGLNEYFRSHQKNYPLSEPRYKGCVVRCRSVMTCEAAKKIAKRTEAASLRRTLLAEFNSENLTNLQVTEGIFKKGDNADVDALVFKTGQTPQDQEYPEVFVSGKLLKKYYEDYTEIRGTVINDYQDYLEAQWIESLKKRYPTVINKDVLKTIRP